MTVPGAAATGEVDGVPVALRFGDPEAEYRALRDAAGVVEQPWVDRLRVTGADRGTFLQGMLSNDVLRLAPGSGAPTLLLTDQGKVVADLTALVVDDAVLLDGVGGGVARAEEALARFVVADDVELARIGGDLRVLRLAGPVAADVLERLGVGALPVEAWAHTEVALAAGRLHVTHVPPPLAGYVLHVPVAIVPAIWSAVLEGGASPVGFEAWDVLRIERGLPWHGRDVGPDTLALEAPYDAAISFAKGCYLGQEVMERVTARGHVNRKLTGLIVAGEGLPEVGARLFAADKDVGWITSAAWSWTLGRMVALGYVRREHLAPGTVLVLRSGDAERAATVRGLPLVPPA